MLLLKEILNVDVVLGLIIVADASPERGAGTEEALCGVRRPAGAEGPRPGGPVGQGEAGHGGRFEGRELRVLEDRRLVETEVG